MIDRRELEINIRGRTESAELAGESTCFEQPFHPGVLEHVDGAELVHRTHLPEGKVVVLRYRERLLEQTLGGSKVREPCGAT
jgi:ribosomal protein L35AE/L33A